jgi:hypothetical protein
MQDWHTSKSMSNIEIAYRDYAEMCKLNKRVAGNITATGRQALLHTLLTINQTFGKCGSMNYYATDSIVNSLVCWKLKIVHSKLSTKWYIMLVEMLGREQKRSFFIVSGFEFYATCKQIVNESLLPVCKCVNPLSYKDDFYAFAQLLRDERK